MKKILFLMLTLLVSLPAMANDEIIQEGARKDGLIYTLYRSNDSSKYAKITGNYITTANIDLVIPEQVFGYSITGIGDAAFKDCYALTSVTLPNTVTNIGDNAFTWCSGLTSVTIPNSVLSIGNNAFQGCLNITSLTISESLQTIGDYAFYGCSGLTSFDIPNSVHTVGKYAFSGCSSLLSVIIPKSINDIKDYTFSLCSSLRTVTIPNSVKNIGSNAFSYCKGLTSMNIPNSVLKIGDYAFAYCSSLTSIIIPNAVTTVGKKAFYFCDGLKKSAYPNTLSNPFEYGVSIVYDPEGAEIENGFIWGPVKNSIRFVPYDLEGEYLIPETVQSLGDYAFTNCGGITSVVIPKSVRTIGNNAFSYCVGITSVFIPNSVKTLGTSAFYGCTGLSTVTLPNSIQSFGLSVFSQCSNLKEINYITSKPVKTNKSIFDNTIYDNATLNIATGGLDMALSTSPWMYFANILEKPFTTNIAESMIDIDSNAYLEVFTLNGVKVAESTANLPVGIYIIRQNNLTKKVVVH